MKPIHTAPLLAAAFAIAVTAWACLSVYDSMVEDSNLNIVAPNTVFRSAQPHQNDWEEVYKEAPLKSIINLRGENDRQEWYASEIFFADERGIQHEDFALSARKEPDMATMEKLVAMMREAPKPLLLHCKQGADRSGLAGALYAYAVEGIPADEARSQLSIRYGHFPWLGSKTVAMDKAFKKYVAAHPQEAKTSPSTLTNERT